MANGFFNFPHTRTYDSDLGWLIKAYVNVQDTLNKYLETSTITFADPITWDITAQYTALTCVVDRDGTAYLSKQPVPVGIAITNTDYWLPIFNYDDNINKLRSQIAYNAGSSDTTSVNLNKGDLVFWQGYIYETLNDLNAGSLFIENVNVSRFTVDEKINKALSVAAASFDTLSADLAAETANRQAADNAIINSLANETEARESAITELTTNITELSTNINNEFENTRAEIRAEAAERERKDLLLTDAINNERLARENADDELRALISTVTSSDYATPEEFGAVGDGVVDDYAAVVAALESGKPVLAAKKYKISNRLDIGYNKVLICTNDLIADNGILFNSTDSFVFIKNLTGVNNNVSGVLFECPPSNVNIAVTARNIAIVGIISGYSAGLDMVASITQRGIQYNKVQFNRIVNCTYGIRMLANNTRTWVNQNQITGGSIYGGNQDLIEIGVFGEAAADAEITSNTFRDIVFEGIKYEGILLGGCNGNLFDSIRMAEEIHGAYWVRLENSRCNKITGYLNFSIARIADNKGPLIPNNAAYYAANRFEFFNMQRGTNQWVGFTGLYSFNRQICVDDNCLTNYSAILNTSSQNVSLAYAGDIDYATTYMCNGYKVAMPGGGSLIMSDLFRAYQTEMILNIKDNNPVTIRDSSNAQLGVVSGYGDHLIKWTAGGLLVLTP